MRSPLSRRKVLIYATKTERQWFSTLQTPKIVAEVAVEELGSELPWPRSSTAHCPRSAVQESQAKPLARAE